MVNMVRNNAALVDMLARVPVNKGNIFKSLEKLLKTIESSESAVMIPTLLKDKCEFDAWELLFVSKILKASILGHSDLVEFYLNHIGPNLNSQQPAQVQNQSASISVGARNSPLARSPSISSAVPVQPNLANSIDSSPAGSVATAISGLADSTPSSSVTESYRPSNTQAGQTTAISNNSQSNSTISWSTAPQTSASLSSDSYLSLVSSSIRNGPNMSSNANSNPHLPASPLRVDTSSSSCQVLGELPITPLYGGSRHPQPPSLLQLTATNNHNNSMSSLTPSELEQLTTQFGLLVTDQEQATSDHLSPGQRTSSNGTVASQELRTSRSAGCLFRMNSSGASSPRTPTTPYGGVTAQSLVEQPTRSSVPNSKLPGNSGAPVKLLLQIEQLKSSISQVTQMLESVVELYKESIDNIV